MQLFAVFLLPRMILCNFSRKQPMATPPSISYTCQRPAFHRYVRSQTAESAAIKVQVHQMLTHQDEHQGKHAYFVHLSRIYIQG